MYIEVRHVKWIFTLLLVLNVRNVFQNKCILLLIILLSDSPSMKPQRHRYTMRGCVEVRII